MTAPSSLRRPAYPRPAPHPLSPPASPLPRLLHELKQRRKPRDQGTKHKKGAAAHSRQLAPPHRSSLARIPCGRERGGVGAGRGGGGRSATASVPRVGEGGGGEAGPATNVEGPPLFIFCFSTRKAQARATDTATQPHTLAPSVHPLWGYSSLTRLRRSLRATCDIPMGDGTALGSESGQPPRHPHCLVSHGTSTRPRALPRWCPASRRRGVLGRMCVPQTLCCAAHVAGGLVVSGAESGNLTLWRGRQLVGQRTAHNVCRVGTSASLTTSHHIQKASRAHRIPQLFPGWHVACLREHIRHQLLLRKW